MCKKILSFGMVILFSILIVSSLPTKVEAQSNDSTLFDTSTGVVQVVGTDSFNKANILFSQNRTKYSQKMYTSNITPAMSEALEERSKAAITQHKKSSYYVVIYNDILHGIVRIQLFMYMIDRHGYPSITPINKVDFRGNK